MATLETLIARVKRIIQDPGFSDDEITEYLNEGLQKVAGGMRRPDSSTLTQPLPWLYEVDDVMTTTTYQVQLPTDYQRDVVAAIVDRSGYKVELSIYDSFQEFVSVYPGLNLAGDVNAIAVKGRYLCYQWVPATSTAITVHYHRYPEYMSQNTDEPDGLPDFLHIPILVNYACKEIFSIIEDGIDGSAFNTTKYTQRFWDAMLDLEAAIAAEAPPFSFFVKGS